MAPRPGLAVGVDLGTTYTCAAVSEPPGTDVRVVQLTGTSQTIPSVVSITDDGVVAGEAAERRLVSNPTTTAREFKRRLGDATPLVLGGEAYGAEVLSGHLLSEVLDRVERNEGSRPGVVGLAHPASWGPFRLDLLRDAARHAGVDDVVLVPEPVAAAVANRSRVDDGALVAVYDLGGGTFDAAVVRVGGGDDDAVEVVGTPEGVERLGGIDFDQAIMAHVDGVLDGQVFGLDSSDPDARSALMRLRSECQAAKEHLSQDSDVDIPVSLPSLQTSVRITRAEFEAMVRPRLADSLAVFDRVVASAGASWDDIAAVLLVGGSSNIPVVAQAVGEHTGRPVLTATSPHLAIAMGTAMVAAATAEPAAPAPVVTASEPAAPAPAPATVPASPDSGRSGPPWKLIIGGVVALVVAVVAVLAITGGGDDEPDQADPTTPATEPATDIADTTTPATDAVDEPVDDPDEPTPDTTTPATEPPDEPTPDTTSAPDEPASLTVGIDECGAGDSTVIAVLIQGGDPVAVGDDGIFQLDDATFDPCSIDLATRESVVAFELPGPASSASSFGFPLAVATPNGGVIVNGASGNVIECEFLTGPLAINSDGVVFTIVDAEVQRIRSELDGCLVRNNDNLIGIEATAVGTGPDGILAVGGTVGGAAELWLFASTDDRVVIGDTEVDGGFGSIDAVVTCSDHWCVIDLERQVLHLVDGDRAYLGSVPLAGTPLEGVARIVSSGPSGLGPAIVTAEAGDGTRTIVRLTAS
jgi:actin-like ATPase involved in cell morphogenesis